MMRMQDENYDLKNRFKLLFLDSEDESRFIEDFESKKNNLMREIERQVNCVKSKSFAEWEFVVSDTKVARLKGNISYLKKNENYCLEIKKIKSSQVSETDILDRKILSKRPINVKDFTLKIATKSKELKIKMNVFPDDNYGTILDRIVMEINNSHLNINAKVVSKRMKNEVCKIVRLSSMPGRDNAFKTNILGNEEIKKLFLIDVVSYACDTEYVLCGKDSTTSLDYISINKNMDVVPLKIGKVNLENKVSLKVVISDIKKTINLYNDLLELLIKNRNSKLVLKEIMRINSLTSGIIYTLSQIGIEIAASGKIICDSRKLTKMLKSDFYNVINVLGGEDGLADRILYMLKTSPIKDKNLTIKNPKGVVIVSYDNFKDMKIGG